MGGYGSGRQYGRPTVDASRKIDIAWMLRRGMVAEGDHRAGSLSWSCGGHSRGSIAYRADMSEAGNERLVLDYRREADGTSEHVLQTVHLTFTEPHFGGKRWWMICPFLGHRVGKLYMPANGDRFASRKAWGLGYHSQRIAERDRPFESLFRLQKRLGCEQGWGNYPRRPKGMHHRTYEQLLDEFHYLDDLCAVQMMQTMKLLSRLG